LRYRARAFERVLYFDTLRLWFFEPLPTGKNSDIVACPVQRRSTDRAIDPCPNYEYSAVGFHGALLASLPFCPKFYNSLGPNSNWLVVGVTSPSHLQPQNRPGQSAVGRPTGRY